MQFAVDDGCDWVCEVDFQELKDDISNWSAPHGCFDCTFTCDINGNGEITPGDAHCAFQMYMGICPMNCVPSDEICCAVNADGECTPAMPLRSSGSTWGCPVSARPRCRQAV